VAVGISPAALDVAAFFAQITSAVTSTGEPSKVPAIAARAVPNEGAVGSALTSPLELAGPALASIGAASTVSLAKSLEPSSYDVHPIAKESDNASTSAPVSPQKSGETIPQEETAQPAANTTSARRIAEIMQVVDSKEIATQIIAPASPGQPSGTSGALDTSRMKSAGHKNENAGLTVQKLPGASQAADDSASLDTKGGSLSFSSKNQGKADFSGFTSSADLGSNLTSNALPPVSIAGADRVLTTEQAGLQVEKVTRLVSQEAMMVRQSGATSLAVSLKLDPQTEIFVQITNHGGQIQASLRCDRGSLSSLGAHWDQLQGSLARHNVQLLPMVDRTASRPSLTAEFSDAGTSRQSNQFAGSREQNVPAPRGQLSPAESTAKPGRARTGKSKKSSTEGWESWA
jgi:hypothetical protein